MYTWEWGKDRKRKLGGVKREGERERHQRLRFQREEREGGMTVMVDTSHL